MRISELVQDFALVGFETLAVEVSWAVTINPVHANTDTSRIENQCYA